MAKEIEIQLGYDGWYACETAKIQVPENASQEEVNKICEDFFHKWLVANTGGEWIIIQK